MWFIGTSKVGTDPFSKLLSCQQSIVLNHVAFAMHPFGLNGVEPRALCGQQEGQDAHSLACLFHLLIVLPDPGAHQEAFVPGSIIPDQEPVALALGGQTFTTPLQKLNADGTDRTSADKAQPHLIPLRVVRRALLPQDSIARQRLGIGVPFFPGLLYQAQRMVLILPGVHARQGKATPPHLIEEAYGTVWLVAGRSNVAFASVFGRWYGGSGRVMQCLVVFL